MNLFVGHLLPDAPSTSADRPPPLPLRETRESLLQAKLFPPRPPRVFASYRAHNYPSTAKKPQPRSAVHQTSLNRFAAAMGAGGGGRWLQSPHDGIKTCLSAYFFFFLTTNVRCIFFLQRFDRAFIQKHQIQNSDLKRSNTSSSSPRPPPLRGLRRELSFPTNAKRYGAIKKKKIRRKKKENEPAIAARYFIVAE
jgi:hypothetical protein